MRYFRLKATPAPKRRTIRGRKERKTRAYSVRNKSYDRTESLMKHWRAHKNALPPFTAAVLGVRTVAAFVWRHRHEFRAIMRQLEVKTARELLACYGRTGEKRWQLDHRSPIRFADHFNAADVAANFHHWNLRPRIACRNKRRKFEPPLDCDEFFPREEGQP